MTFDPLLGKQLDEYRLEALLGQGGMARVYRGLDVRLKRYAAVKVIGAPFRTDSEYMKRFEREAQAIAQLEHPHIVRLYRYGEADGLLYMAMQYVQGSDLGAVLHTYEDSGEFMEPVDISRIIREIGAALDYAHGKGVIHRDIKPSNIMMDQAGQAILTDFGLVLLTEAGTRGEIFGTPHYIAPEQAISSAGAVPQSDFYAIGVILYRMFTGVLPFEASDPLEMAMRHLTEEPTSPRQLRSDISPEVEAVILKTLAKEAKDRYPDGATLAKVLDQALRPATVKPALAATASLTIVERVALHQDELPPLPAAVSPPLAQLPPAASPTAVPVFSSTPPQRTGPALSIEPRPEPAEAVPAVGGKSPINRGRAGAIMLAFVLLATVFLWVNSRNNNREEGESSAQLPIVATDGAVVIMDTPTLIVTPPSGDGLPVNASQEAPTADPSLPTTPQSSPTIATPTGDVAPPQVTAANNIWLPLAVAQAGAENAVPENPTPLPPALPAPTARPTQPSATYQLFIVARGKSLFIMNQSQEALFLAGLSLMMEGGNENEATLDEWNRDTLESGACILVHKDGRGRIQQLPAICPNDVVQELLIFPWADRFTVYYNGATAGDCDMKSEECSIFITGP